MGFTWCLQSKYLEDHGKTPKSFTFEIEIEWLAEYLQIPKSYKFADMKRRILDVAKKQFLDKTNLKFDYEEVKFGKKVIGLKIKIENNGKGSNDFMENERKFIAYMRKNFVNQGILKVIDKKNTDQTLELSIAPDGTLYDKLSNKNIDNVRSKKMWAHFYSLACGDKLEVLNERKIEEKS